MTDPTDDDRATYASPPCFMHELDGFDPQLDADVMRWRKAERERLLARRRALPQKVRQAFDRRLVEQLDDVIGDVTGLTVSGYWPFRAEPDLRALLDRVVARGGNTALPVAIARATPLVFRAWRPGDPLARGLWNILVPEDDAPEVCPDIVIAPVVGFDPACYRLGYGGGFFDRTLAAMAAKPRVIGVGYSEAAIATIYPQAHDIAMDFVVTETGPVS